MKILVKDAEEESLVEEIFECLYYRNLDIWYKRLPKSKRQKADVLISIIAMAEADDLGLGIGTIEERELLPYAIQCITLFEKSEFLLSVPDEEFEVAKRLIFLADVVRLYSDPPMPESFSDAREVIAKIKSKL